MNIALLIFLILNFTVFALVGIFIALGVDTDRKKLKLERFQANIIQEILRLRKIVETIKPTDKTDK
jgi:hypothetical protein